MPLDVQLFRTDQGGDPEKIRESQRRRFKDPNIVDQVIEQDNKQRAAITQLNLANKEARQISIQIGNIRKKAKQEKRDLTETELKEEASLKGNKKENDIRQNELQIEFDEAIKKRDELIFQIGNLVPNDVPVSKDEANNGKIKKWGVLRENLDNTLKHHHELLYMIGGYEPERGAKVAGHRGYFLTGPGVILNMALQNYGINFLISKKYTPVYPPFFMKKSVMQKTAQLSEFDEALYHVNEVSSNNNNNENENDAKENDNNNNKEKKGKKQNNEKKEEDENEREKYLIATSEQPISAMHLKETMEPNSLPIRYAGISTNFRKEAGSHGKDAWGIFRVHQFDKIEQFVICAPDESWNFHEEMLKVAEEFYQSLEIAYEVVNIVSGELNNAAAKKYDLEGWFPTLGCYRELVSCSNCTDYQSRAMNTRFGHPKQGDRSTEYVHMLNATLCATTRTMCCILENYQTKDGINVPKVLQPYCGGVEFFPFVRKAPINKEAAAKEKKGNKQSKNKNTKKNEDKKNTNEKPNNVKNKP